MPSEREGFGLPLLESLACGTPVVASDIAALREVGGDVVTYCAVGDIDAWANAIGVLLDERAAAAGGVGHPSGTGRHSARTHSAGRSTPAKLLRCTRAWRMAGAVLKVLHVGKYIHPPVPGGMERVVETLCRVSRGRLDSRVSLRPRAI